MRLEFVFIIFSLDSKYYKSLKFKTNLYIFQLKNYVEQNYDLLMYITLQ